MIAWRTALALAVVALAPAAARAEPQLLTLQPQNTSVTFTLKATGHHVNGRFPLQSGRITFDPATGAASGQITIDARQAETGNHLRDGEMHAHVLESERYPVIVFTPNRFEGTLSPSGVSVVVVRGIVALHGSEHPLALTANVTVSDGMLKAETTFDVPYVEWGLHDPSILFLRVAPVVTVSVKAQGDVRPAPAAAAGARVRVARAPRDLQAR